MCHLQTPMRRQYTEQLLFACAAESVAYKSKHHSWPAAKRSICPSRFEMETKEPPVLPTARATSRDEMGRVM